MLIRIATFTENGRKKAKEIFSGQNEWNCVYRNGEELGEFVEEGFRKRQALLFIGACGIAVRLIAPFVKDKLTDSPVVVMDEKGKFVIPILSGHIGGANNLARKVAKMCGGECVITTETDLEQRFAVDLFAKEEGFRIINREGIAKVSSKVLRENEVTLCVEPGIKIDGTKLPKEVRCVVFPPKEDVDIMISQRETCGYAASIYLVPKKIVVGVGCKKGKTFEELLQFTREAIAEKTWDNVKAIASIDLKKDEMGLIELANYYRVPFLTFTKEQLKAVEGDFSGSTFVESITGVDNVCERAALCALGENGYLIEKKKAEKGITIAIAGGINE